MTAYFSSQTPRTAPTGKPCDGFTLIEVLVAMLVLAVGLLGVAAMQLRGLQYSHDAYLRSQISVIAYDMADRIRLNRANAAAYVGTYTVPTVAPAPCTALLMTIANVTNDLICLQRNLYDALPPGTVAAIAAAAGGEYTIDITWRDRDGRPHPIQYTFQP